MIFTPPPVTSIISTARQHNKGLNDSSQKAEKKKNQVKDIIVAYNDGTYRKLEHGFAVDINRNGEECVLDYMCCTDEDFKNIMYALIQLGKEKGVF